LIMPYIEQGNQYAAWNLQYSYGCQNPAAVQPQPIIYLCPTRPAPVAPGSVFVSGNTNPKGSVDTDMQPGALSDYAVVDGNNAVNAYLDTGAFAYPPDTTNAIMSTGPAPTGTGSDIASVTPGSTVPVVLSFKPVLKLSNVTDGLSNTIFVGEKHLRPTAITPQRGQFEDRSVLGGIDNAFRRFAGWNVNQYPISPTSVPGTFTNYFLQQQGNAQTGANNSFGSFHVSGVQFVFGDGSVKMLNFGIDSITLTYLAVINDGQAISANSY
jgi:hypothetical protein